MERYTKKPQCSKCNTCIDLYVWCIDDEGCGCQHEIICSNCPKPTNIFKDWKSKYNPDYHDKIFGFKDYDIPWSYTFRGNSDPIYHLCFQCNEKFNASDGYGHEYVHEKLWKLVNDYDSSISFCKNCYPIIRKEHIDFKKSVNEELFVIRLKVYFSGTVNGKLLDNV